MALIKCPECGHDVSDLAFKCPNCGYPMPPKVLFRQEGKSFHPFNDEDLGWSSIVMARSMWLIGGSWVPVSGIKRITVSIIDGTIETDTLKKEIGETPYAVTVVVDDAFYVPSSRKPYRNTVYIFIKKEGIEDFEIALLTSFKGGHFQIEDEVGNIDEKLKNGGF